MRIMILNFLLVVLITAIVFTADVFAKDSTAAKSKIDYQRIIKISQSSLENDVPGIVEGSIYNVILLKKYYPNADYSEIIEKLNKISDSFPVASIKYKAHLASMYLTMSNGIDIHPLSNVYDHEYLFKQIAEQLETKLLVAN